MLIENIILLQLDKEILDTELEMYALQSEGQDISQVRSRLLQLKSQATHLKGSKHFINKQFPQTVPLSVLK